MIIYFSGGGVAGVWQRVNELLLERGAARLLSFAYSRLLLDYCALVAQRGVRAKVMIDSGAFTAWTKGDEVDLDQLSDFVKRLQDSYSSVCEFVMINLDVIPGRKGTNPTKQQIDDAMTRSVENFGILDARFPGIVLPVFHQGEPSAYYSQLVAKSDYVCLSPRNDVAEKWRVKWSRDYTSRVRKRYHGLATTGMGMMETVRWHSIDSAAWVMVGGYGGILYKTKTERGLRFNVVTVSSKSAMRKVEGKHIETMTHAERDLISAQIAERKYSLDELKTSDTLRYMWNAEQWLDASIEHRPITEGVLFDD